MAAETIQNGDRVHDRDDPDPNDAIVVNQPPKTASEWEIQPRDCTLADDNPDYPADAAVVVVCFVDDLLEYGPPFDPTDQTQLPLATLIESGVHFYTFPAPRLTVLESPATGLPDTTTTETDNGESPIEEADDPEPASISDSTTEPDTSNTAQPADESEDADTSPSPDLQQLTATLEAYGLTVEQTDGETLTIERLGQTYHIRPGEGIEGDGALRSQLETLVDDAI